MTSYWRKVEFLIKKRSDKAVFLGVLDAVKSSDFELNKLEARCIGGKNETISQGELSKGNPSHEVLDYIFDRDEELVESFIFTINSIGVIKIERSKENLYDSCMLNFETKPGSGSINWDTLESHQVYSDNVIHLVGRLKDNLHVFNSTGALDSFLGGVVGKHYEVREAELLKLENALANLTDNFQNRFLEWQTRLDKEYSEKKAQLDSDYEKKNSDLLERERLLQKRIDEVDDQDSKHARRQIRKDLKNELIKRSEKFELTDGTQKLRAPVKVTCWILLTLLFGGTVYYGFESAAIMTKDNLNSTLIALVIFRQLLFMLGFASTVVFFIRWSNAWAQRHAKEEFRLKKLELDFERASWVVETSLEWQNEKDSELPKELMNRLTENLFKEEGAQEETLHPLDQLASALLGSAAGATLKLAGGNEIKLDRKSTKQLNRGISQSEEGSKQS